MMCPRENDVRVEDWKVDWKNFAVAVRSERTECALKFVKLSGSMVDFVLHYWSADSDDELSCLLIETTKVKFCLLLA